MMRLLRLPGAETAAHEDGEAVMRRHAVILERNLFLRRLYMEFYSYLTAVLPGIPPGGVCVELGSGCGFLRQMLPNVITSDVLHVAGLDHRCSALAMPFRDRSVRAVFMLNTLHHITDPAAFFAEVNRCLKYGGKFIAVEPANTLWARFVFKKFHHEPFDPAGVWLLDKNGPPMETANGALPWILFNRDRAKFESMFPDLSISSIRLHTPVRYILSGGFSLRQLLPLFTFNPIRGLERCLSGVNRHIAMFQTIEITKRSCR